jgi:hypothetical protein
MSDPAPSDRDQLLKIVRDQLTARPLDYDQLPELITDAILHHGWGPLADLHTRIAETRRNYEASTRHPSVRSDPVSLARAEAGAGVAGLIADRVFERIMTNLPA